VIAVAVVTLVLGCCGSVARSAATGARVRGVVVVAVVSAPGESQHSWLEAASLEGRRRHRLTPRRGQGEDRGDFDPAVSPDGRRVAFLRRRASGDSLRNGCTSRAG
jgi:hypothetical protein